MINPIVPATFPMFMVSLSSVIITEIRLFSVAMKFLDTLIDASSPENPHGNGVLMHR